MSDSRRNAISVIIASRKAAASHIENIKNADPLTEDLVKKEIFEYLKSKFHLADEDCTTDSFSELAGISLAKSVKISPELVEEFDLARSCDGVSSQTAKMVLFLVAIQKDLGITFDPMDTVAAETIFDIGALVYKELVKSK